MGDFFDWLVSLLFLVSLLVVVVYQIICMADLESDYVNPYDASTRINGVVIPEFVLQGLLCCFYVLTGHWFMLALSLPYLSYNIKLYVKREHRVDVTEIFTLLSQEKMKRFFKLSHIALFLFITTYWLIHSALEDNDG